MESQSAAGFQALFDQGARANLSALDPKPHDGVRVALVPGAEIRYAHWDDVTGIVVGDGARTQIQRLIDVSRGRVHPDVLPAKLAAAFDEAKRRKESFLLVIDIVGVLTRTPGEDGLALGLGFAGGVVRIRASIDARHVAAVVNVTGAAAAP